MSDECATLPTVDVKPVDGSFTTQIMEVQFAGSGLGARALHPF
jgi:hypothetical protein